MKRMYTITQKSEQGERVFISIGTKELLEEYKAQSDIDIEYQEITTYLNSKGAVEYMILPAQLGIQSNERLYFIQSTVINGKGEAHNENLVAEQLYFTTKYMNETNIYNANLQLIADPSSVVVGKEELMSTLVKSTKFGEDGKIFLPINTIKEYKLADFPGKSVEEMITVILTETIEIIEQHEMEQAQANTTEPQEEEEVVEAKDVEEVPAE